MPSEAKLMLYCYNQMYREKWQLILLKLKLKCINRICAYEVLCFIHFIWLSSSFCKIECGIRVILALSFYCQVSGRSTSKTVQPEWNELKMKHAFQSSILCNENDFPTYPRPSGGSTGRSASKQRTLNWSFVDGNTLANPLNVSTTLWYFPTPLISFTWIRRLLTATQWKRNADYGLSLIS